MVTTTTTSSAFVDSMKITSQFVMYHRIQSALREAYQSKIGQKILTTSVRVYLNHNLKN